MVNHNRIWRENTAVAAEVYSWALWHTKFPKGLLRKFFVNFVLIGNGSFHKTRLRALDLSQLSEPLGLSIMTHVNMQQLYFIVM